MVDEVAGDGAGVGEADASTMVEAHLVVENPPAGSGFIRCHLAVLNSAYLGGVGSLLDDEVGDSDIVDGRPNKARCDRLLDQVRVRIVADRDGVDAVVGVNGA